LNATAQERMPRLNRKEEAAKQKEEADTPKKKKLTNADRKKLVLNPTEKKTRHTQMYKLKFVNQH